MPWQSYPTVPYAKEMATSSCDVSRSARRMHRVRTQNGKRRGVIPTKFVPRAPPISPLAPAHGNGKAGVVSLGRHPMIGWIKFGVPSRGSRPLAKHGSCCSRRLLSARHDNTKLFLRNAFRETAPFSPHELVSSAAYAESTSMLPPRSGANLQMKRSALAG